MKVKVNENTYIVKWTHHNNGPKMESKTYCFIRLAGEDQAISTGECTCSVRDSYNRQTGRKLSLARALQKNFDRCVRQKFWDFYDQEIGLC